MKISEFVPDEKFRDFHEILCATGGRYLAPLNQSCGNIWVVYEPGDYEEQCRLWRRLNTPIKEVRRDQRWRTALRRVLNFWRTYESKNR